MLFARPNDTISFRYHFRVLVVYSKRLPLPSAPEPQTLILNPVLNHCVFAAQAVLAVYACACAVCAFITAIVRFCLDLPAAIIRRLKARSPSFLSITPSAVAPPCRHGLCTRTLH